MSTEPQRTFQILPFGSARLTVVIPSAKYDSDSDNDSGEVRILRGNTAEEGVSLFVVPEQRDDGE